MNKLLSIIIPIKINRKNFYLMERLAVILDQLLKHTGSIEYLVVDSSTNLTYKKKIKAICTTSSNIHYIYCEMPRLYSAARSRNKGVYFSKGKYILFYDVDLIVNSYFLNYVCNDIENFKHKKHFTLYPCLYLGEEQTKVLEKKYPTNNTFEEIKIKYLSGYNDEVNYLAVNTSTILVNKKHFLEIGGYNEDYEGHGYEDFDLIHKLYTSYPIIKRDEDYPIDFKTNVVSQYKGFRKNYSYYALPNFFKGTFTLHLWHPRPLSQKYYKKRKNNLIIFLNILKMNMNGKLTTTYLDETLPNNFHTYIYKLIRDYNLDPIECKGLFQVNQKNIKRKFLDNIKRKTRKLILNPSLFFKDIKK